MKKDCFFAEFSNLGVGNVPIADEYPEKFDRLLCGGIWCIVQLDYEVEGGNNFGIEDIDGNPLRSKQKKQKDISPISIRKLTPIQMPHVDIDELKQGRKAFTKDEWLDITDDYGFISDYLAEFIRELRKEQYGDALDHYFRLGKNLNQRDTIAVRRMVDGYLKLMYPNGEFTKEELEEIIQIALEMRRRVKEQLKKLGGMEFYDVNFSYIDLNDMSEHYISVPEQGGGKLIPDGMCNPGQVYTVSRGKSGMLGVFRLESQMLPGNGKIERTGLGSDSKCKEAVNTAFNYLKANGNRISGSISTSTKDYIINYQDLQGIGMTDKLALPTLIALCSIALGKPVVSNLAVLGDITISGTMIKVDELANTLQVCLDSGAKKVLIPSTSFVDFASVPADLMSAFQLIPYQSAEDAVFKALGVE